MSIRQFLYAALEVREFLYDAVQHPVDADGRREKLGLYSHERLVSLHQGAIADAQARGILPAVAPLIQELRESINALHESSVAAEDGYNRKRVAADDRLLTAFHAMEPFVSMESPIPKSIQPKGQTRTRGRRKAGETDTESLVIAALSAHHRHEPRGVVGNYEPAILSQLAGVKGNPSKSAFTRFLKKHGGYKGYRAACAGKRIGKLLSIWNREPLEQLASLRHEEDGSADDDE